MERDLKPTEETLLELADLLRELTAILLTFVNKNHGK